MAVAGIHFNSLRIIPAYAGNTPPVELLQHIERLLPVFFLRIEEPFPVVVLLQDADTSLVGASQRAVFS